MRTMQFIPILFLLCWGRTVDNNTHSDDKSDTLEKEYRFINGSVSVTLPRNWIADEDEFTVGKFLVVSDERLKDVHKTAKEAAMGMFRVEVLHNAGSPADILAHKLYEEGGSPVGAVIEALEINQCLAARMAAIDEMFGQSYLWHAVVIQVTNEIFVYTSFTGLGDYETNGMIDAVIETLVVDSATLKAILKAG